MNPPEKILYFGPYTKGGHFLRRKGGHKHYGEPKLPWEEWVSYSLAAGAPGRKQNYGCLEQPQGHAKMTQKDGWTALAFWDRSFDLRGNCVSGFYVNAILTFEEMMPVIREEFAELFKQIEYEIVFDGMCAFEGEVKR